MKEKILKATHTGELKIASLVLPCYVLEDEKRVLSQSAVVRSLGLNRFAQVTKFVEGKSIKPFINNQLLALVKDPITFLSTGVTYGFEATILSDICDAVLESRKQNKLHHQQKHIAEQAEILTRAFAKIGIIALVDEATGYQYDRKYDALRTLAKAYIEDGLRKWVKTFPDSFFAALDKIYKNEKTTPRNRPKYYGKFIVKYVYNPIENGFIKSELNKKNIADDGTRKARFHQWLTELGKNQLLMQIGKVEGLMESTTNKRQFKEKFVRLTQMSIFDFIDDPDE